MIESPMITFPLLILFLPLISFIILIFFGKKLPRQGDWVAVGSIVTTFILAVYLFVQMLTNYDANFSHGASLSWIDMGAFKIDLGILVDNLTIVMLLIVTLVSSCTHIFSLEYMKGDVRYNRYYAYLGLFTFSMNGIVLADNLISMYMSWELVGVSSYLLIGHWFEKDSAANASKKAFLTNRVGDIGFFIGIMLLYSAVGAFTFAPIFDSISGGEAIAGMTLTLAGLGIFMGAVGKSSQFPLHIWLPDAMEGPTPVSALMHAATMVAAGVYLTVRLFPIFTPDALLVIAYVGGFTAIFAATIAITQNDIKKVLAYSTVSQLGYMILAVGVGNYVAAFFHLLTHAMFKACLFYGSGSVIHAMHHSLHELHDDDTDPQDMRNMGGLKNKMPITSLTMTIATLAIAGVPLFSGFLSKDAILAGTLYFVDRHPEHLVLALFGFGAAAITAFYMFRLIFLTFYGEPKMPKVFDGIHESPKVMTYPLIILAALSFFIFYTLPYFNPFADYGWFTKLIKATNSAVPGNPTAKEIYDGVHYAHYTAMTLSLIVASVGIGLSFLTYYKKKLSPEIWTKRFDILHKLSLNKYYFDENYNRFLYQPFLKLCNAVAYVDWDLYDKYFINGFGHITKLLSKITGRLDYEGLDQTLVDGIGKTANNAGKNLKTVQTGRLQNYMLFALIGVIIILVFQAT